jgi:hypothetical protein
MHQLGKNHVFIFRCVEGAIEIERFGGAWRSREVMLMIFWDVDKTNLTVAPGLSGFPPPHFLAVHYLLLVWPSFHHT